MPVEGVGGMSERERLGAVGGQRRLSARAWLIQPIEVTRCCQAGSGRAVPASVMPRASTRRTARRSGLPPRLSPISRSLAADIPPTAKPGPDVRLRFYGWAMSNTTVTTLDDTVFERLLQERIIVLGQEVDDAIANRIIAQLLLLAVRFLRLIAAESLELRGTARLLSTVLRPAFITRLALVVLGAVVLPLLATEAGGQQWQIGVRPVFAAALLVALAGEIVGRYLFFVSVVPMHMTAPYVAGAKEAA